MGTQKVFLLRVMELAELVMYKLTEEYFSRLSAMYSANNRAMAVVTLERADGRQIMRESIGAFPDMTPIEEENITNEE